MSPERPATGDRIVGRRIAAARDQRGWTQADLAEAVGYSLAWVRKLEQAERGLNTHQLRRLAQALGVSAAYLIGESELLAPPRRSSARLADLPEPDREAARQLLRFQRRVGERWRASSPDAAGDAREAAPIESNAVRYADNEVNDGEPLAAPRDPGRRARRALPARPGPARRRFRRLR